MGKKIKPKWGSAGSAYQAPPIPWRRRTYGLGNVITSRDRARKKWKEEVRRQALLQEAQDVYSKEEWERIQELIYSEDDDNTRVAIEIIKAKSEMLKERK